MDPAALGRLLLHLAPTDAPDTLTVDRTEWHFGLAAVNVLTVGVACGDVAVPIAWTALPNAGGSGSEDQIQVLEAGPSAPLQPVDVVMKRTRPPGTSDPFVILAVWKVEPSRAMDLYRERWSIETLFAALKSRGFDLEQTHLTAPDRIERLIGLLALELVQARLMGERRTQREGSPRRKSHGRRQRSRFRYGLDRLQRILTTPRPQPTAFFECLRLLRRPTSILSCT
jgi:hypothetical protein